ncbi:Ppx/GppA phosphatase family protein [Cedecea neteri]|uniref:Ppx/GppA phosphatase family protein n=1 Tax=Cedecea neteri TaxID=158822 RepID=UPI0039081553
MTKIFRRNFFSLMVVAALPGVSVTAHAAGCEETRAGIDMGSGTTKLVVAKVDTCKQRINKVLFEDQRPIGFNEDLSKSADNTLSPAIQQQGQAALRELAAEAARYHPARFNGVATAVFRSASNAQQTIDAFNRAAPVNLKIITQEQEAELGFLSAKASMPVPLADDQMVVWDIGGGSMQMTTWLQKHDKWQPEIYQGKLASVTLKNYIIDVVKNKDLHDVSSPNPIGSLRDGVLRFVRFYATTHVSPEMKQALAKRTVVGIGGVHDFSVSKQLNEKVYTLADLQKASASQVWKGDSELRGDYRATDVSNLLLVQGYMEALKIPQVTVVKANLVQGVLIQ